MNASHHHLKRLTQKIDHHIWKQQGRKEQHLLGLRICKLNKVVVMSFSSHILQQF
jgi:hypothetical protein